MRNAFISNLFGLGGAFLGGLVGYYVFFWIVSKGFYGLMIPGALMGLGCSLLAQHRSLPRGIAVGIGALALGLVTEWKYAPFKADGSFSYLLAHVPDLNTITQLMIAVGGLFGFWMGKDANPLVSLPEPTPTGSRPNAE